MFMLSLAVAQAKVVEIKSGGFSIEVPDDAELKTKEDYKSILPDNALLPRIQGKNFFLSSVKWSDAPKDRDLNEVLSEREKIPGFQAMLKELPIISRQPFTSASGVPGIRYIQLRTYPNGNKVELHRFIFLNKQRTIICLGLHGDNETIEKIYASVSLAR